MYVWRLRNVINAEGSVQRIVDKAKRAKLSALWIKIADGQSKFENVAGDLEDKFKDLVTRAHDKSIEVWGWQVPHAPDEVAAQKEAALLGDLAHQFGLDGLIMDAEGGAAFFQGGVSEAIAYGLAARQAADNLGKPLGISSNDIPQNIAGWLPKFNEIAKQAILNFPQTYYGASPSVQSRVDKAATANAHLSIPFIPVGAGFLGTADGGCASASDCAARAATFMDLCETRGYEGYSYWHWAGAPMALWETLNTTPV
jgi:hypothetical protein